VQDVGSRKEEGAKASIGPPRGAPSWPPKNYWREVKTVKKDSYTLIEHSNRAVNRFTKMCSQK